MKNLVQELMNDRPADWLAILETEFKIHVVRDGDLVSLKYNQLESPMHEAIVQQCRGMVVDAVRRRVLAWPYNKFWNHGESGAATIDWSTARVQEKLDGSLMILFHDGADWRVASSGHPTAGGSFSSDERTFRDAFWATWKALGMELPTAARSKRTAFMFELCDAPNRVVVRHAQARLVVHGARDLDGPEMHHPDLGLLAKKHGWELVNEHPITSIAECLAAAEALDPLQQEGFVVVDAAFNRLKIKSPRYVILHHMKGEATPRRAIELWQTGETSELLAHFPEMASAITPVQERLDSIATQAVIDFYENRARPSRKEFALAIKDRPWSAVLFRLLEVDQPDIDATKAIMRRMTTAALERMIA